MATAMAQGYGLIPPGLLSGLPPGSPPGLPSGFPPGAAWSGAPHGSWAGDPGEPVSEASPGSGGGAADDGSRGGYKCSKCGMPKKGHVCAYQPRLRLKEGDEAAKETRSVGCQVEMDPALAARELPLHLQGTPESYQSAGTLSSTAGSSSSSWSSSSNDGLGGWGGGPGYVGLSAGPSGGLDPAAFAALQRQHAALPVAPTEVIEM
jgi:hypothetical protein